MGRATPGVDQHFLWKHRGDDWPVVICDEQGLPKKFLGARRSNEIPAILLGQRKYLWVLKSALRDIDPHEEYVDGTPGSRNLFVSENDDLATRTEKQRLIAFLEDLPQYETSTYWKNYINSERAVRQLERSMSHSSTRTKTFKRKDSVMSEEVELMSGGRSLAEASPSAKKKRPTSQVADHRCSFNRRANNKWVVIDLDDMSQKPNMVVRGGESETSDGCAPGYSEMAGNDFPPISRPNGAIKSDARKTSEDCTIYVGDEGAPFIVPLEAVHECALLSSLLRRDKRGAIHVYLPKELAISAKDFTPVAIYLRSETFTPKPIQNGREKPCLKGIVAQEQKDEDVERIAMLFNTASKLQFANLQRRALEKLLVASPFSPTTLLVVATCVLASEPWDEDLWVGTIEFIGGAIAESFWVLVKEHGERLERVLREHDDLKSLVLENLAQQDRVGCNSQHE